MVGGSIPRFIASTQAAASVAAAAPSRCPVIDLVAEVGGGELPKTLRTALASDASPTFVDVAWALMYPTSPGAIWASARAAIIAELAPAPSGCDATMW